MVNTLKTGVMQVLESCRGLIPNAELDGMIELVDHDEWGIALENLCTQLHEHGAALDELTLQKIERLGSQMRLSPDHWVKLRRNPFRG